MTVFASLRLGNSVLKPSAGLAIGALLAIGGMLAPVFHQPEHGDLVMLMLRSRLCNRGEQATFRARNDDGDDGDEDDGDDDNDEAPPTSPVNRDTTQMMVRAARMISMMIVKTTHAQR